MVCQEMQVRRPFPQGDTAVQAWRPTSCPENDVAALAARCAEETQRFLLGLPVSGQYGMELFRRALVLRDERAWEVVYECYGPVVRRWANRIVRDPELAACLIVETFERFWLAVDAAKLRQFPDLPSLLRYLKLCLQTAALDRGRVSARRSIEVPPEQAGAAGRSAASAMIDVEREALDAVARREFWQVIQRHFRSEADRVLAQLSFVEDLPPREICRRVPTLFPTVSHVYKVKRNMLDRLRQSAAMRELAIDCSFQHRIRIPAAAV